MAIVNQRMFNPVQILTTYAWSKYYWNDTRLAWNPEEADDLKIIHVDAEKVISMTKISQNHLMKLFNHYLTGLSFSTSTANIVVAPMFHQFPSG